MNSSLDLEKQYCAHNYHPLPVVLTRGVAHDKARIVRNEQESSNA